MSTAVLPAAPASTPPPAAPEPRPLRWTRDDFYQMENLPSVRNQKIMLIDGEVLVMAAPSVLASISHSLAEEVLRIAFPAGYYTIRSQLGMYFGINTDPVPDIAVIAGSPRTIAQHPNSALLIVEVADTSLAFDTGDKAGLYAAAGIKDYWAIDVVNRQLHVFRDPQPDPAAKYRAGYRDVRVLTHTDTIAPLAAPTHALTVGDLLP